MGLYIGETLVGKVLVASSSGSDAVLQAKTATPSETVQTITADVGYDGLSSVEVDAISTTYVGSGITRRSNTDLSVSGATVSAPAGYYNSAASKSVTTTTQATPSVSIDEDGLITATATQTAGYVSAGNKSGTLQLTVRDETDMTISGGTVTAPSGYYPDSASKSIASGTTGTPTATKGTVSNHSVTITPSVTNTTGYITGGTKTGTAVNVSASELVSGTLSITSSGTKDVTNYASASVASGSATTPTTSITANPSISVSSSGLITATASASKSITPTVTAGYVSSGTAGTVSVSGSNTQQLTAKGATTYNTSATDQTIASGQYLTGVQTIKAVRVSGLSADSILSGVTVTVGDANDADRIASVTGTVAFQTYYTGSTIPSSSLGVDGDIYLLTS